MPKETKKFKDLIYEIEQLVETLESGELDLEEGIGAYKNGLEIIKEAKSRLEEIEHKFEIIES